MALVEGILGTFALGKDETAAGNFVKDILTLGGSAKERGAKEQAEAARAATEAQTEATQAAQDRLKRAETIASQRIARGTEESIATQLEGFQKASGLSQQARDSLLNQIRSEQGIDRTSAAFNELRKKIGAGADRFASDVQIGATQARQALEGSQAGALASLAESQRAGQAALAQGAATARGDIQQAGQLAQAERQRGLVGALGQLDPALQQQQLAGQAAAGTGVRDIVGQQPGLAEQVLARQQAEGTGGFEQDPGFQFALEQQEEAINRAAAARGGRFSGRTLRELQRGAAGLASQQFDRS